MSQELLDRAVQLMEGQQFAEAKILLAQLSSANPGNFDIVRYCGLAHQYDGDYVQAIEYFSHCLKIKPKVADCYIDIGTCFANLGDYRKASEYFQKATAKNPKIAMAHNNLGFMLYKLGHLEDAEKSLRRALKLDNKLALAYKNIGHVFQDSNRWGQAAKCYAKALKIDPQTPETLSALVYALRTICDWKALDKWEKQLLSESNARLNANVPSHILPFIALFLKIDQAQIHQIVSSQALQAEAQAQAQLRGLPMAYTAKQPTPKLRIGYLSSAFRGHATCHLAHTLFGMHDKSRFEIFAYSGTVPDLSNEQANTMVNGADHFADLSSLSDEQAARTINADKLHILVDLDGYISDNRHTILAMKPAPVQVNYLGYPGTSGGNYMDYIIGDKVVTPTEYSEHFSEHIVRLPHCYQYNNFRALPESAPVDRETLGLPESAVVYCCFNITRKIEPEVFQCWMNIAEAVPDGVFWFVADTPETEKLLKNAAEQAGVDSSRLIFANRVGTSEHMARQKVADIFLDTFYCSAHTTASDALWSGLPIVTLLGETFANRVAASAVSCAGLEACIAQSKSEYEQIAIQLGNNREQVSTLKAQLAEQQEHSPLFDSAHNTRNLENAFEQMWSNHVQGVHTAIDL